MNKSFQTLKNNPTFNHKLDLIYKLLNECSESACGPQSSGWERLYEMLKGAENKWKISFDSHLASVGVIAFYFTGNKSNKIASLKKKNKIASFEIY